jgi:S1-C subfamily serine protease
MNLKRTIFLTFMALLPVGCANGGTQQERVDCVAPTQEQSAAIQTIEQQQDVHGTGYRIRRVADHTRNASVQVHNTLRGVRGSGTYFVYDGYHIIITAAHVVADGGDIMLITSPSGEDVPALLLYFDDRDPNDTAILVLRHPLESRSPMNVNLYSKDVNELIGEQTVYTGDPGHQRNMTIYGTVSSINANGSVMLQSYAWGGASGSLVFDDRARIVGILKAIDVNRSGVSPYPQINENVVWLSPPSSIDLDILSAILIEYGIAMEQLLGGIE